MSSVTKQRFAATIVQYQHDAALGERLNIGVVLVCPDRGFARARFQDHLSRISAAFPGASLPDIRATCKAIAGLINKQPELFDAKSPVELVNQVIAPADAALATSDTLKGITADPQRMLDDLFHLYIDVQQREGTRHRDEQEVIQSLLMKVNERKVPRSYFSKRSVGPDEYQLSFKHVWKNGRSNALQPVSFDLNTGENIRDKAASWSGRLHTATPWKYDVKPHIIIARPPADASKTLRKAADDGRKLLRDQFESELADGILQIVDESEADLVVDQIEADYRAHHG